MHDYPALEIAEPSVTRGVTSEWRATLGRTVIRVATTLVLTLIILQFLKTAGVTSFGFDNWRPVAVALLGWSALLCLGIILSRGQHGEQAVFLLPAVLLTVAFVIFPTIYALFIAFNSWNLSAAAGRQFNGLDNYRQLLNDGGYWNAMRNMVYY
nr:sugar ABC transporter permease [Chloroflexia bacterium]